MSDVRWFWHWNPAKWQIVRYQSPSRRFVYVQIGPLVRTTWKEES